MKGRMLRRVLAVALAVLAAFWFEVDFSNEQRALYDPGAAGAGAAGLTATMSPLPLALVGDCGDHATPVGGGVTWSQFAAATVAENVAVATPSPTPPLASSCRLSPIWR